MTDLATFLIPALVVFGVGVFLLVLLAPLVEHRRWSRRERRRGGWYL